MIVNKDKPNVNHIVNKITADIKPDRPGAPGLWINVYHDNEPYKNSGWPIEEEEIPALLEACKKYLEEHKAV